MRFRDIPVQRKLTQVIMLTCGVALLMAGAAFMISEVVTYKRSVKLNMSALAKTVGESCAPALAFDDPDAADKKLATLTSHQQIVAVGIYQVDGTLFAAYPTKSKDRK